MLFQFNEIFAFFFVVAKVCSFFLLKMNAGAVTLTDCVFWFILVPYLTIKGYKLNFVSRLHYLSQVLHITVGNLSLLISKCYVIYLAVDYKYAFSQCYISTWWHCSELLGKLQIFHWYIPMWCSYIWLLILSLPFLCYFSGSLGFGLDTSFYGQQFMSFSSGLFMPASQSGNNNAVILSCCISIMFNQSINY